MKTLIRLFAASLSLVSGIALAVPSFVGAGTPAAAVNTTAIAPTVHASTTTNDTLLAIVAYSHDSGDGGAVNTPAGYTSIKSITTNGSDLYVFCKNAGASESAPSITSTDGTTATGDVKYGVVLTFRGLSTDCSTIVAHNNGIYTSLPTNIPQSSLTVTTPNTMILAVGSKRTTWTSVATLTTDSAAWSEAFEGSDTNGDDVGLVVDWYNQTTATSVSAGTFTVTGAVSSTANTADITLSLNPSGPGSTPGGKTDVTLSSIGTGTWCEDFNAVATPDIAVGDIIRIDSATTPDAYTITHGVDCGLEYSGSAARQTVDYDVWDTSASGWMSGGPGTLVFNNNAPSCSPTENVVIDVNSAMTAFEIDDACPDQESDQPTCSLSSGTLPTGTSLGGTGNCTLSGTPTVENEAGAAITVSLDDGYGGTATKNFVVYPITTITVPTCTGGVDVGACVASIETLGIFLTVGNTNYSCSPTVASSNVISQSPAAAAEVEPGQEIDLVVSTGTCTNKRKAMGLALKVR